MKIFLTGADGFIGSHLTERLVRDGYEVTALAQYNSFNSRGWLDDLAPEVRRQFRCILGDVRDAGQMRECLKGCDAVLHLASLIAIPFSYDAPQSYIDTNVYGTLNILQAARDLGVNKVIHTSTSEVYGTAQFVPITEDHPLQGQSPYSASKIAADQLAYSFYSSFELPVITVRPFNTYGPRQSLRAVIPTIISQLAHGETTLRLGAITPTRDFNYVCDTVSGFAAALEADVGFGEVINLGSDFEISIGDTAALIAEIFDLEVDIIAQSERIRPDKSEVKRLWACNAKAKKLLGWSPGYAGIDGLRRGLTKTRDWFAQTANLKHYNDISYVT